MGALIVIEQGAQHPPRNLPPRPLHPATFTRIAAGATSLGGPLLHIMQWRDPVADPQGLHPCSRYVGWAYRLWEPESSVDTTVRTGPERLPDPESAVGTAAYQCPIRG